MAMQLRGDAPFSYAMEHYLDTVYRAACHNAPTVQDAEDVTQEVFEALLPMLEGDFRQMDASSFAALRENLDSLNITAQQRKALLQLLSSGVADICAQSQATTLANLEALLQELKALNPDAQIVLVGYYNPVPLLPAPANPFVKHFRTLNHSVQKLAQQYDVAFASAAYTLVANDAHPTACGHKYLARQILKALEK